MKRSFIVGLLCLALSVISTYAFAAASAYKSSAFGYAAGVTGGNGGTVVTVNSISALETELKSSGKKVIIITQNLTFTNHMSVQVKDKTLLALPGVKLISNVQNKSNSGILYIKSGSTNIIFRNLTFAGPGAYDCDGWDNLCFDGVTKAWVDHCDFQDGCDGNFDNKGNTDNITVSWCRFRYLKAPKAGGSGGSNDHRFTNLVGSSSSAKPSDGKYTMTWAYCWWDEGCRERMLRMRNSEMHFLNSVWTSSVANYYCGPENAQAVFDGCYFGKSKYVWKSYGGTNPVKFNGCFSEAGVNLANSGSPKTPTYSYSVLSYSEAKNQVQSEAGATLNVTTSGTVSQKGGSSSNSGSSTPSTPSNPSTGGSTASTSASYIIVTANSASSLKSAISTANSKASASARAYVFVPNGTYNLGSDYNTKVSSYVSIIGQSRDGVIIKNTPATEGLGTTATLYTTGSNIYMQDITLQCRAAYNSSTRAERSVAWWDHGTKNIMKNVTLDGTQDTYWSNGSEGMLAYFEGGYIKGTTDFICGSGSVFFNSVNIYCQNSSNKTSGDCITAPSTYASEKGYVFHYCSIGGTSSQAGTYNLGRPWQNSPASAWMNTKFNILPTSAGWTTMSSGLKLRFREYNNTYNGNAVTGHSISALKGASGSYTLYASSASGYALTDVLGSWGNTAYANCQQVNAPSAKISGATISWSAVSGAKAYLIEKGGAYVAITTSTSYTVNAAGSYTVRAANQMGGFGVASAAVSYGGTTSTPSTGDTTTPSNPGTSSSATGFKALSGTTIFTDFTADGVKQNWISANNLSSYSTSGTTNYIDPATDQNKQNSGTKQSCKAVQVKNNRTIDFKVTNISHVIVYAYHTNSSATRNLVVSDGTKSKTVAVTPGTAVSCDFYPSSETDRTIHIATDETSGVYIYAVKFIAKQQQQPAQTASAKTWDFSQFKSTVTLADNNKTYAYDGLTLVGNTAAGYTKDFVNAQGFHCNGASTSAIRHIKYTPAANGTLKVYFKSNNTSDLNRTSAIGTAVGSPMTTANCGNGQMTVNVTAGKTYFIYFVSGGQTITKVVYTPNAASYSLNADFEAEETAIDGVESVEEKATDNAIYSLSGEKMPVGTALPVGTYIKGGKVIIVK